MIQYDLIKDEIFMGEPPPVLYIFGSTKDFHKLAISLLPFLKKDHYYINNHDIDIVLNNITISMSNKQNNGISISESGQEISVELDRENWTDIIIELITLSLEPSHSYFEYTWLDNLECMVIIETYPSKQEYEEVTNIKLEEKRQAQ